MKINKNIKKIPVGESFIPPSHIRVYEYSFRLFCIEIVLELGCRAGEGTKVPET